MEPLFASYVNKNHNKSATIKKEPPSYHLPTYLQYIEPLLQENVDDASIKIKCHH